MAAKPKAVKPSVSALDIAASPLDDRIALALSVGNKLTARWGTGSMLNPGFEPEAFRKKIYSFGLPSLDVKSKIGGFLRGTITELFGPPHAGKSLMLYKMIASVQHTCLKCDGYVRYHDRVDKKGNVIMVEREMLVRGVSTIIEIPMRDSLCDACNAQNSGGLPELYDQESTADPVWMATQGIELTKLIIGKLPTGEHALEMIRTQMLQVRPDFIGIDSIAQLQPMIEQQKSEVDDKVMPGLHARVMARLCRQVTSLFLADPEHAPAFVWVNQMRADMSGYGKDVVTGGFAPEHYSALRLKFTLKQLVNNQKPELGRIGAISFKKCKIAKGVLNRSIDYVMTDEGFDVATDLYNTAISVGVFHPGKLSSGRHFYTDADVDNKDHLLAGNRAEGIERLRTDEAFNFEVRRRTNAAMVLEAPINLSAGVYIGDGAEETLEHPTPEEDGDVE